MNRTILGITLGILALVVAVPVLAVLFLLPMRAETGAGPVNNNQAPSDLQALTVHDRLAIQLTWTTVDQGTYTYRLQRSEGGGEDSWDDLTELLPGTTSYLDDDNLQDGVTYLYRIYAWDPQGGSAHSNSAIAVATALPEPTSTSAPPTATPAPAAPSGLSQDQLDALQAELNANREKWQQTGVSDYTFEFRVNCFCLTSITAPVSIEVRDTNTIESISYVETGEPVVEHLDVYLTVGEMFDMIQEAIDMKVSNLTASYDPETGYPTNVFIDREFMMADEEHGFVAQNLEPIKTPTQEEMQSQLNSSRELWESSGLVNYEIEYRRMCFCPEDITSPVIVSVSNGVIDSRAYAETGEPVGEAVRDLFPGVPGLFDIVQDAIDREAARITVSYELNLGYPVSIAIDYDTMIVDEEQGFAVISLK